jgi:hypothetical protein
MEGETMSREKVKDYLDENLPLLNLKQWEIKVSTDLPGDDAWADIEASENLWIATLRLNNDFFREAPEHQRRILAHEMMHLHYASIERLIDSLEDVLGAESYVMLTKLWDVETERAAEAVSYVLAEALPLPVFKEARKRA